MADTFFGFNTSLTDDVGDQLPDDPGQILDEEEEEYDALNDETFGSEAVDDWEEDHEKLVEITEQSRNICSNHDNINSSEVGCHRTVTVGNILGKGENPDLDLEARLSRLVLEDYDSEIGDKHSSAFSAPTNYSSSAPSCYSMWGVGRSDVSNPAAHILTDIQSAGYRITQPVLPDGKKVCTVQELERDLLSKNNASSVLHPTIVHVEDVERELTAPPHGLIGMKAGPSETCASAASQDMLFTSSQSGLCNNGASASVRPQIFPPGGSLQVPVQHAPRPILGRSSVMVSSNVMQPQTPPFAGGASEVRQVQQQNHRLISSAPNLLHFLVPRIILQQQQPQQQQPSSVAGSKPHLFPTENNLLHSVYYRSGSGLQGSGADQHHVNRGALPGHFQYRASDWGPHFNGRSAHYQHNRGYHSRGVPGSVHSTHNGIGPGEDEYAGLMTQREKQWLMNIQHLQLNTSQPFVDDYYYKMFVAKRNRKNTDNQQYNCETKTVHINTLYGNEQQTAQTPENQNSSRVNTPAQLQQQDALHSSQGCTKAYTPAQFENSLGKLQVGSVTAPRKVIDMDLVSPDSLDSTVQSSQKDARRSVQLLLTIEWMYGMLLQIEDLASPVPELRETAKGDKVELLHKLLDLVGSEIDVFVSIMCVSKGKGLIKRLLLQMKLPDMESEVATIFCKIFSCLVTIGRRDGEHNMLLKYLPIFEQCLDIAKTSTVFMLTEALNSLDEHYYTATGISRNVLVYALSCKFGTSVISLLLKYSTIKNPYVSLSGCENWTKFIDSLVYAASFVPPSSCSEHCYIRLTPELLDPILNSCSTAQKNGATLRRILLGEMKSWELETITET